MTSYAMSDDHPPTWLSIPDAALYAGVPHREIAAAVARREVLVVTTHPSRPGEWMLAVTTLEIWMAWRLAGQ